jgi:O-antigen/teichoic acid export membrane protein
VIKIQEQIIAFLPVAARGSSLIANALMAIVVARLFGVAASGEFFLALTVVNVAGMVGRLGTDMRAIKVLPAMFHDRSYAEVFRELGWLRKYCRWGSVGAAAIVIILGALLFQSNLNQAVGLNLVVLAASVPFASSAILDSSALRSANRFSRGAFAETGLTQGITLILLLGLAQFTHLSPISAAGTYLVSSVLTAALARVWVLRSMPARSSTRDSSERFERKGDARSAMFHMMWSSVLFYVLTSSALFALGVLSQPREIGLYNAATRVSTILAVIPALQVTYLIPRVARALSGGDIPLVNSMLRRAARQATALTVVAGAIICVFSNQVIGVFGSGFAEARSTLIVLLIGQAALAALGNVNPLMAVVGLERRSVVLAAGALMVGAVPLLLAASSGGSSGVAITYIAMSLAYSIACVLFLRSRLGIKCFV